MWRRQANVMSQAFLVMAGLGLFLVLIKPNPTYALPAPNQFTPRMWRRQANVMSQAFLVMAGLGLFLVLIKPNPTYALPAPNPYPNPVPSAHRECEEFYYNSQYYDSYRPPRHRYDTSDPPNCDPSTSDPRCPRPYNRRDCDPNDPRCSYQVGERWYERYGRNRPTTRPTTTTSPGARRPTTVYDLKST
ncbi:unnamed protein product [Cyprideis torosa]|uniref:Uncharacterized protein n=1 Tax=Cyprideis torosa TaxID=163714 RepID=A0A7R8WBD6_9CRUS|nr:unnamed protein product [Cyprideis torosa]CAG0887261.1 unnamed protein product [Cyprideis torosa]